MAVICGLDLYEIKWEKFKYENMWNKEYHLRRSKFIVYQLAMILGLISESTGISASSTYARQQRLARTLDPTARVHADGLSGIAAFNVFVCIYVSTVFGAAFFLDLIWPERYESAIVRLGWRIGSGFACVLLFICALAFTCVVATEHAYLTGHLTQKVLGIIVAAGPPLAYRKNGRAVASVVFLWLGMVCTGISTYFLWHSLTHTALYGPKSAHARNREQAARPPDEELVTPKSIKTSATK